MGIGVFLMAVGAILAFAVHVTVAGVSIQLVGLILIAAGLISFAYDYVLRSRRTVVRDTVVEEHRPTTVEREIL